MATRRFNKGIYHLDNNQVSPVKLFLKFTGAADVEANGFTINAGAGVSTVARTDEGDIRITLTDVYHSVLGITVTHSKPTLECVFVAEDVDGATPYVDLTFVDTATGGTPTDPDAGVVFVELTLKNGSF